jgi:hypothetical protein
VYALLEDSQNELPFPSMAAMTEIKARMKMLRFKADCDQVGFVVHKEVMQMGASQ